MILPFMMTFMPTNRGFEDLKTQQFSHPQILNSSNAETPSSNECIGDINTNFQPDEELVYKVYYNLNFVWIPAGEVTFKLSDEGEQYHLEAVGRTYDSYNWFYKAHDDYNTYVDKNTLLPKFSTREIKENRYKLYDKVAYDQVNKTAYYERGPEKDNINKTGNLTFDACMYDVLSVVYYARTQNYTDAEIGKEFPVKVNLDQETYSLKYTLSGREDKNIRGLGKWSTLKLSPQLVAGNVFTENSKMKIWASNDENKIPLMIESPVSVGSVKVVLKSWKNLKFPTTAKKEN